MKSKGKNREESKEETLPLTFEDEVSKLENRQAVIGDVIRAFVTHSAKLSAASSAAKPPNDVDPQPFAGDRHCVGSHLLSLAQKLDNSEDARYSPYLLLARYRLLADPQSFVDSPASPNRKAAMDAFLAAHPEVDAALQILRENRRESLFVDGNLPQVLVRDGEGYISVTPVSCGGVQGMLAGAIRSFNEVNKAETDAANQAAKEAAKDAAKQAGRQGARLKPTEIARRTVRTVRWHPLLGALQMGNLSGTTRDRRNGGLYAIPPVADRNVCVTYAFGHDPVACFASLTKRAQKSEWFQRRYAGLLANLDRGFAADGTSRNHNDRENNAVTDVFKVLSRELAAAFKAAEVDLPSAAMVADALPRWMEGAMQRENKSRSVSEHTLYRWRELALPIAERHFPIDQREAA